MGWFAKSSGGKGETPPVTLRDIEDAQRRLSERLPITPCTYSHNFSDVTGRSVFLKWDNKLKTGSFKERGVLNFLLSSAGSIPAAGVCAASAGNHALALARHTKTLGIPCTLVMPERAPVIKVTASQNYGAKVILHGLSFSDAYEYATHFAQSEGMTFVPAFDHPRIIAGQGVAGLELLEQTSDLDAVVVPVGGGGYISGIALVMKELSPGTRVIGVQSEWALRQRSQVGEAKGQRLIFHSLADGIAVKSLGAFTRPMVEALVDEMLTVSESDVADGIIACLEHERTVVEGAGAAGVAALLAGKVPDGYKNVAIMVCGSNIDMNVLSRLIDRDMNRKGRLMRFTVSVPDRPGSLNFVCSLLYECKANVLETLHDHSFSQIPGNVDISFMLEVRDRSHRDEVLQALRAEDLDVREHL